MIPILVLTACNSSADSSQPTATPAPTSRGPAPEATPAANRPPARPSFAQALEGHEQWVMSSEPCVIQMKALPAPKPGQNLGQLAIEQGHEAGQLRTSTVKNLIHGQPPGPGDDVPVIYVETSRTEAHIDPGTSTYAPGASAGTAYVFDRRTGRFACMAAVKAESSSTVTALSPGDSEAAMWIEVDLMSAVDRQIVANAHAISVGAPATHDAEVEQRFDKSFGLAVTVPRNARITWNLKNNRTYGGTIAGTEVSVAIRRRASPVKTLAEAVRLSMLSDDHVVQEQLTLPHDELFVSTSAPPALFIAHHYLGALEVSCTSSRADMTAELKRICLAATLRTTK